MFYYPLVGITLRYENYGGNLLLLSGVFDGHAGTAASETVSHILPPLFTTDLEAADTIRDNKLASIPNGS